MDVIEFDGRFNSIVFLDWLDAIDEFFEWYNLSDAQCLSMARIKLVANATCFWKTVVRDVDFRTCPLILSWDEMRDILKNKYVPNHCMNDLLDQFLNVRQYSSTVAEYSSQFELRYEVDEE